MIQRFIFLLAFVTLFLTIGVQGQAIDQSKNQACQNWVDSVFNSLSEEERIAQLLVVRANDPGKEYYTSIEKYITDYNIGGVCFFRNHPYHQAATTNHWQSLAKTPLLISIDAEWGLGMRLDSTTVFPFQMTLGAIQDNGLIYQMGATIADQCKRIGIQMNFAPVVDINSNPGNPVIGMRSFGQDKENVMLKGLAYMQGLQEQGVIATAKHFPGHGDTESDSHKTLPVIAHSVERLDSLELYPFKQLINKGLGGIMIAHLYIPAYDNREGIASTLSPFVVTDLLRDKLGFNGLIVTDALDMKGVTKHHKPGDIEVQALLAGNDILLLPANIPKAIRQINKAVKNGVISRDLIKERCKKVLTYKFNAGLFKAPQVELEGLHQDLNRPQAAALNRLLYEASATLVRNENNILPLTNLDTLSIAYVSTSATKSKDFFGNTLGLYAPIQRFELPSGIKTKDIEAFIELLKPYDLVIFGIQNTSIWPFKKFGIEDKTWTYLREIDKKKKLILDLFGSPYALTSLGSGELPEAIIISYQDNALSEEVGAEIIFGGIGAMGKLPVKVAGLYEEGNGLITQATRLRFADPALLGISESYIHKADSIIQSGIDMKAYPGCQVLAVKDGNIFYHKTFGHHSYKGEQEVQATDLYDLASLTKIAATAISIMDLSQDGDIDIDYRLSYYLPYLKNSQMKDAIIREMMAHQARFQAWIPFYKYTLEEQEGVVPIFNDEISEDYNTRVAEGMYIHKDYYYEMLDSIRFSSLRESQEYRYSDLGFYLLKEACENISNTPFEKFTRDQFYKPLGLTTMGYLPLERFSKTRITPTEDDKTFRKQVLRGDVHDQGAAMLGGVSGHAGLFSNAFDMAVLMQMLLDGGSYGGKKYLNEELIEEFTTTQFPLNLNRRAVGFDKPPLEFVEDGPVCKSASDRSFGHSGFTGTYAWADPENGLVYIFLSNRVHPDAYNPKLSKYNIRTNLHQIFYEAIENAYK